MKGLPHAPAWTCAATLAATTATCVPGLGPGDSGITSTRILGVQADPAEAAPGAKVTFTAFVAGPGGVLPAARVRWDFCVAPLPLTEDNAVSTACLGGEASPALVPAGGGPAILAGTPAKGCSLFGPDTPPGGFRPADPDSTGGYYQPLRAELAGAQTAFALARIHCDLANANAQAASAFAAAYKLNANPVLNPVRATVNGGAVSPGSSIPAGATVTLTASWPTTSAETYAYFDATTQTVTTQHEAMQLAWYATAGALSTEATGRASTDSATRSENTWTAPNAAGEAHLFVVLRDSRGGVDFTSLDLPIE